MILQSSHSPRLCHYQLRLASNSTPMHHLMITVGSAGRGLAAVARIQVDDHEVRRAPVLGCCGGLGLGYAVAVRARSRVPAVVPMYMSRVMRMLACPARRETSAGS